MIRSDVESQGRRLRSARIVTSTIEGSLFFQSCVRKCSFRFRRGVASKRAADCSVTTDRPCHYLYITRRRVDGRVGVATATIYSPIIKVSGCDRRRRGVIAAATSPAPRRAIHLSARRRRSRRLSPPSVSRFRYVHHADVDVSIHFSVVAR